MLNLKAQRESLKLTLEDVGNYVGVGKSTVRKWENGMINNMGRDKILKYAKILQISPLALIGEVETEAPDWASKDDVIVFDEALKRNSVVMSYDGIELSEEDKMQLDGMIRAMLWERIKKGKTKSSKRKITIPDKLVEILQTLTIPDDLTQRVFKRVSNNAINKALQLALNRAGIDKDITFHAMRHTHASILLANGVQLLSVSKRLGHADPNITLHTYAHIIEELEQEDNEKLNSIFN